MYTILKCIIIVFTIRKKKDTVLQKAGTSGGCSLSVMVSYFQTKNLACFNPGFGQGEKMKIFSENLNTRWHAHTGGKELHDLYGPSHFKRKIGRGLKLAVPPR